MMRLEKTCRNSTQAEHSKHKLSAHRGIPRWRDPLNWLKCLALVARRGPPSSERSHSGCDFSSDDGDFDKGRYGEQDKHGSPHPWHPALQCCARIVFGLFRADRKTVSSRRVMNAYVFSFVAGTFGPAEIIHAD